MAEFFNSLSQFRNCPAIVLPDTPASRSRRPGGEPGMDWRVPMRCREVSGPRRAHGRRQLPLHQLPQDDGCRVCNVRGFPAKPCSSGSRGSWGPTPPPLILCELFVGTAAARLPRGGTARRISGSSLGLGAFDQADKLEPRHHIFTKDELPWAACGGRSAAPRLVPGERARRSRAGQHDPPRADGIASRASVRTVPDQKPTPKTVRGIGEITVHEATPDSQPPSWPGAARIRYRDDARSSSACSATLPDLP